MIRRLLTKIKRFIDYGVFGWSNADWDNHYLMELQVFKLKRMLKAFLSEDSYHDTSCVNYKIKIKSLKLAVKLGEMLCADNFNRFFDKHEKKWGQSILDWLPSRRPGLHKVVFRNKKALTNSLKEQMNKEFREAVAADRRTEERARKWFYNIINKYSPYWWD